MRVLTRGAPNSQNRAIFRARQQLLDEISADKPLGSSYDVALLHSISLLAAIARRSPSHKVICAVHPRRFCEAVVSATRSKISDSFRDRERSSTMGKFKPMTFTTHS